MATISTHRCGTQSAFRPPNPAPRRNATLSDTEERDFGQRTPAKPPARKNPSPSHEFRQVTPQRPPRAKTQKSSSAGASISARRRLDRPARGFRFVSRSEATIDAFDDDDDEAEAFDVAAEDIEVEAEIARNAGGSARRIDDPVRMYLMQMGEIPLLTRAARTPCRQVDRSALARGFAANMLASDFVLQGAVHLLEKVRDGALRLDRTIEVSVTNTVEKKRILRRLGPNLETLVKLLRQNQRDFRFAISKSNPPNERHDAWRRLVRRRDSAVRLVEELNLRTQRLQPMLEKLSKSRRACRPFALNWPKLGRPIASTRNERHSAANCTT